MTFDLVCKVLEVLDSKEAEHATATRGGKVLRVTDGTKCQMALLSVAGKAAQIHLEFFCNFV
jgi:hypothetical protein